MSNTVIITGATGGLGKSYVYECAKRGFNIVLSATKQERLDFLKAELESKYKNIMVWAKQCNLSKSEDRVNFFEFLAKEKIVPNMLINNAGYILEGSFMGCSNEEITNAITVNTVGTLDFTYKFLNHRNKNVKNYCLIVSSLAGFYPMPQMAVYGSTKSMLNRFAVAVRQELKKDKVNVSVVCPGSMATNDDMKLSIKSQGLGGRLSLQTTEKVARVSINKLLKNKAKYIPGFFNKTMWVLSKLCPETLIAKLLHKRWVACEKKRNQYR